MQSAASTGSSTLTEVSAMSAAELAAVVQSQAEKIAALEHQIEWFRRQIFGQKSERFSPEADPSQMHLGETFPIPATPAEEHKRIAAHARRSARTDGAESGEDLKFFDESKVPVQTITLLHADLQGVPADQYEIIGEKVTYRIAQRPGAYRRLRLSHDPRAGSAVGLWRRCHRLADRGHCPLRRGIRPRRDGHEQ
jgi:transposase